MNKIQLSAIKSYLKNKDDARPVLSTIQTSNAGKQFILNGYNAFMWREFQKDFTGLPVTPTSQSINIDMILPPDEDKVMISQTDLFVWHNITKYLGYIKIHESDMLDYESILIYFCGRVFDYKYLKLATIFCGKLSDCKLYNNGEKVGLKIVGKDVTGFLLPRRTESAERYKQIANQFFSSFYIEMKGAKMKFSLINVAKDNGSTVDGNWIQNHIGTLDTAIQKAKCTKAANSNRINIAVVEEVVGTTPGFCTNLVKLAIV